MAKVCTNNKHFTKRRFMWLDQIAADSELTASAVRVAMFIGMRYLNSETGLAFPSYKRLAVDLGSREKVAIAAVALLKGRGHLVVALQGRRGRGSPNHYAIVLKPRETPTTGEVFEQENLLSGGCLGDTKNLLSEGHKTSLTGELNHVEPHTPSPLNGVCRSDTRSDQTNPLTNSILDPEVDRIAAVLLATLPPRPDSIGTPSEKLKGRIAAALASGTRYEELINGAQRYHRFIQARYGAGPFLFAKRPEVWIAEKLWAASWAVPARNGATADDAAALLHQIRTGRPP
jgi:hypothetical protein